MAAATAERERTIKGERYGKKNHDADGRLLAGLTDGAVIGDAKGEDCSMLGVRV
jgi:hypothetical protein